MLTAEPGLLIPEPSSSDAESEPGNEFLRKARALFEEADGDKNRELDLKEIKNVLRKLNNGRWDEGTLDRKVSCVGSECMCVERA